MPSIQKGMLILVHYLWRKIYGDGYICRIFICNSSRHLAWWIENGGSIHRDENKEEKTKEIVTDEKN